jgi:hypothetical protein
MNDLMAPPTIHEVLADFSASHWLKDALRSALQRDPVDAANDAEILYSVLAAKAGLPQLSSATPAQSQPVQATKPQSIQDRGIT